MTAGDDGINVAGGVDGSGMQPGMGGPRGGQATDFFSYTGENYLYINGGTVVVDAEGDGLDANGAIQMTGGLVIVNGPTNNSNGALDYDGGFQITGGVLVAAGSAGMAQAPVASSTQNALLVNYGSAIQAGTLLELVDATGESVLSFASSKPMA